ncbi:nickel ABC transporter permease [Fusibacter sp. 3D3]|uniref:nickel ABC transporter permease n=1 Tax=Fusibacter sp. 3D3 TaxID=1048380 RepID=UPI000852C12F|nr:nickel ABC transporter permease [Fusibacter sp. 3D3]GAU76572.1 dipeptide transport system permease protein DppB [Fusibacter sp. 3D3]
MKRYFISRSLQMLMVMLTVSFFTFGLSHLSPSDPAEIMLLSHDTMPTEELLERTRAEMGLNETFLVQYFKWLRNVLRGDLGESYAFKKPVITIIAHRIGMTFRLAFGALLILVTTSLSLGILSAIKQNKIADYLIRGLSFGAISMPSFWLGLILIYCFAVKLHWFKIADQYAFASIFLPSLTLAIPLTGKYIRQIRAAVLDEYTKDYVIGARARGIREHRIIWGHVLPNAMLSILTLLGLSVAFLIGGTAIVENIFSWPGLGTMALNAITNRDYPILQAYVLFMAFIYVGVNYMVDIVSQMLYPMLKEEAGV